MPDLALQEEERQYHFEGEDAELFIVVWANYSSPVPNDTLVAAGEIHGTNRRLRDSYRLANIVYEDEAGALRWRLYRFSASGAVAHYELGPRELPHGLARAQFRRPE
jgi:hypothetical protein